MRPRRFHPHVVGIVGSAHENAAMVLDRTLTNSACYVIPFQVTFSLLFRPSYRTPAFRW